MKISCFPSSFILWIIAGMLSAGASALSAQDSAESLPPVQAPETAGGRLANSVLSVPNSLKALWEKGGATDFSDAAWEERIGAALDRWDGLKVKDVAELMMSEAFYQASSHSERLSGFAYDPTQSVSYSANAIRLRGILVIPEDGEYSFAVAADDVADLWLGEPGGSRFTKKKVLSAPNWTNHQDWSRYHTEGMTYKAGDLIWIEILGKNGGGVGGKEHYAVAWKKPGDTEYSLIPGKDEAGKVILTVPPVEPEDLNDVGVPQSWLNSVGLGNFSPGQPSLWLYADTDEDGFNLLEEYRTGGRPDAVGGNTGYYSVEKWTGATAKSVELFTKSDQFLQAPNETWRQEGALDLTGGGSNYFTRLRTRIVPPLSGEWTFYIAADDSARLLLSTDGQRFLKRPVAEVLTWTDRYQWTKSESQKSKPVLMQAGTPYFMEVLHYQQLNLANVAVAWQYKAPNLCAMEGVTASQSSVYENGEASLSIDGNQDTRSCTNVTGANAWWQVDFPLPQNLNQIVIYTGAEESNPQTLSNFRLSVLGANGEELAGQDFYTEAGTQAGEQVVWNLPGTLQGKSVRIQSLGSGANGDSSLSMSEVEIYEQNEYSGEPVLITGDHVQTIPEEPNDTDNNSLPDDWQEETGLVPGRNGLTEKDCAEYSDPDGDLAPNFAEYLLATNPLVPSGVPGYLMQEIWWNLAGWSIDDAIKSPELLERQPSVRNLLKEGLPGRNVGNDYVRRLRGTIKPPVTGEYTFWISSDETSILYLSSDDRKFHKKEIARVGYGPEDRGVYLAAYDQWDAYPKQRSKPIHLEAGREYFIEADHKEYHSFDHLQIAWQMPGGERELIPGEYMASFGGDLADRDDDDLPDEWEIQYGIKADDNGAKDFGNGAWGDPYNTGITNREAYLLGWDPRQPSLPDFGDSVMDIPLSGGVTSGGLWGAVGDSLVTPTGRGSLTYTVTIPARGRYLLEITATPTGNVLEEETLSFEVQADGHSLGSNTLRSIRGAAGRVLFLLPEMEAGSHTLTIILKNTDLRRTFAVNSIRILKPEGQSADGCEVPEWLHDYLGQENALTNCPAASLTSPLCMEGKARALHLAKVTANGTDQKIEAGAGTGWYANVDLPADGSALPIAVSFESGAHSAAANVAWEACDLLTHATMNVRQGDSLRVAIDAEGTAETAFPVTITVDGSQPVETTSGTPIPVKFDTPGQHTVRANWTAVNGGPASAAMDVHVTGVELGEALDLITGLRRTVTLTEIPDNVLLQNAAPLRADKALGTQAAGTRKLEIWSEKGGAQHLVARLGESGPILDTLALFSHTNSSTSTLSRVEPIMDYGDGSSLMCLYLASESLPAGGYIKITLTAGGAQFLTGGTELIVRAEDFGQDGLYRIMMTAPSGTSTSICHIIRYYDKDGNEL